MSTRMVNRIEPRTGDKVEIVGFGSGGRVVNSGMLFEGTQITLAPNTTINNVMDWTIPKTAPGNKVAVFIEIGSIQTRSRSTTSSSGVVVVTGYISDDGGSTSVSGQKTTGCAPPSNVANPRDNWIVGNLPFSFIDTTNSPELNLSFTAIAHGDSSEDRIYVNYNGTYTSLTWLEFEGI